MGMEMGMGVGVGMRVGIGMGMDKINRQEKYGSRYEKVHCRKRRGTYSTLSEHSSSRMRLKYGKLVPFGGDTRGQECKRRSAGD